MQISNLIKTKAAQGKIRKLKILLTTKVQCMAKGWHEATFIMQI